MLSSHMITQRPKEDLILSFGPRTCVRGNIVQFLNNEQIQGIRLMYKNVKSVSSAFFEFMRTQ